MRSVHSRRNSGQTLVVTALVISLLIISVVYSVFEARRGTEAQSATTMNSHVLATKLGLKNTVTSALVNVSNGGTNQTLSTNLYTYVSFIGNQSYFGKCDAQFTVSNTSPYQSGIWMSWGSDGTGVSSAYANFTLFFTNTQSDLQLEHATNITTRLDLDGTYVRLGGTSKQVNMTCSIFNEGELELAQNITLYYDHDGNLGTVDWILVDSSTVTDYGNGTYTIDFIADTQTRGSNVIVSAQVYDLREIFVLANVTCTQVS